MTIPDIINGVFESSAGLLIGLNCLRTYKDKGTEGVSIFATSVFTLWGFWNIYYYKHLDQIWSWVGGMLVVGMNCLWLGMMIYYNKNKNKN
jgi:uncharacterized membrane protein YfcA